jgi:CBS domain-containing protein
LTIEQALRKERLGSLPLFVPTCVSVGTSLGETLRLMRAEKVGVVLVCDGERLAGIFTERDVLNKLLEHGVDESEPVDRYMTPDPEALGLDDTLGDAVRLMTQHGYRNIPLLDEGGKRVGIVAARDIVHFVAEHFPAEVVNLPPKLKQTFKEPEGA